MNNKKYNLGIEFCDEYSKAKHKLTNLKFNKKGIQFSIDKGESWRNFKDNRYYVNMFIDDNIQNKYYTNKKKLKDYLYEIWYDDIDYEAGKLFFENNFDKLSIGRCSSVKNGKYYGRNFDFYYDNNVNFVMHIPRSKDRYASISIGGSANETVFTKEFVESNEVSELYKVLPFVAVDGINEKGLCCNLNVTASGDYGYTTGTNTGKERLYILMVIRYIIDKFDNAYDAAMYVKNELDVYINTGEDSKKVEYHIMVSDINNTYIIEFINNKTEVTDVTSKPYMTNFYIYNTEIKDGHIDFDTVTDHGDGLERYNLIIDNYDSTNTLSGMKELMCNKIRYTKTYERSTDPFWKTEYVGKFGELDLTIHDPIEKFEYIIDQTIYFYENRTRFDEYPTWQTVYTSIYDLEEKKVYITSQEEADDQICISLFDDNEIDSNKRVLVSNTSLSIDLSDTSIYEIIATGVDTFVKFSVSRFGDSINFYQDRQSSNISTDINDNKFIITNNGNNEIYIIILKYN